MHRFVTILFALFIGYTSPAQAAGFQSISVFGGLVGGYNIKTEELPWSIMAGGGFEYGTKRIALYADIHSLPLFQGRLNRNSAYQYSYVMGTLGMTLGNKIVRAGPFISAGYIGASAGARLVLAPKGGPNRGWHGMEYRIGYYMPNVLYGTVLYTWRWTRFGPKPG